MGHDIYCAICGGPAVPVTISTKSRSKAVSGEKPTKDYDFEIITKKDAGWTRTVMALGFHMNTKRLTKQGFPNATLQ